MVKCSALTGVILTAAAAAAPGAEKPAPLGPVREFPHAGIALAAPAEFRPQCLSAPYDVLHAVVLEAGRPTRTVTLSAFPVAPKVTAEEFAKLKMEELAHNRAIGELKSVKKATMPIAGLTGSALRMSYTFGGVRTLAAQVYFVRDAQGTRHRICYLLTVTCSPSRQERLLPTLGAVARSVKLLPLRHPHLAEKVPLGEPVEDFRLGFRLPRPAGWYAARSALGVELGQVDYLLGGVPMPSVQLIRRPLAEGPADSRAYARADLENARREAQARGETCRLVAEGPARLGTFEACEFVLLRTPRATPDAALKAPRRPADEPVALLQRTACLPAGSPEEPPRVLTLTLTARGKDLKPARALMKTLAEGLQPLQPASRPASRPATRPTATRPAATRPTTSPASRPAAP